jgi:serpin B
MALAMLLIGMVFISGCTTPETPLTEPVCGNGICEAGETQAGCPADCGTTPSPQPQPNGTTPVPQPQPNITNGTTPSPQPQPNGTIPISLPEAKPEPTEADNVVSANNMLAVDMYKKIMNNDENQDGNIFLSPYSISSALAMTYEGAKGGTAEEMRAVLHLPSDISVVRDGFKEINTDINKENNFYNLSVANALWAQENYPFEQDYFSTVSEYYGGEATNLDFVNDAGNSRTIINDWVESRTNDRIKDILPVGIPTPLTRMILTNTIYFKSNWSSIFETELTKTENFTLDSGNQVQTEIMHQGRYFNYGETDYLQMLEMDYLGFDLSMLILLPKDVLLADLEASLSTENLDAWKDSMERKEVIVSFPKFKFETKYILAEDLKAMGMPTAFKYPDADFTGMSPTDELYIDEVIHQTFIEVTESGTEAAAATAVVMGATGAPGDPPPPKVFTADHPFIFIIQQKDTGNILFMGRVMDPR